MLYFPEQYGGMQTVFKSQMSCCKKHSLNEDSADNGSTAFNFMDEEFLRNCEHFLPDPTEIPSNGKIEAYPFLKYKLRIPDL